MLEHVAPEGTVTTSESVEDVVIAALTDPNKTMFSESMLEKFEPLIVTELPTGPDSGANEMMIGAGKLGVALASFE